MELKETLDTILPYMGINAIGFARGLIAGTIFGFVDSYRGGHTFANISGLEKVGTGACLEWITNGVMALTGSKNVLYDDMGGILGTATGYKVGELLNKGLAKIV